MVMDLRLAGQRVVVTGASSGIGRAAAQAFDAAGARLALLDRDEANLAAVGSELAQTPAPPMALPVDVADEAAVDAAFATIAERWGGIDVVVNVAGIMREQKSDIRDITLESWRTVIDVNLTGSFLVARAAARVMIPAGRGVLVLVGSPAGVTSPSGSIPYGASKGGVNGLALTLDGALASHGIRVHNFLPGSVETPLYRRSLEEGLGNGAPEQYAIDALRKAVSPEGVGRAIALLASPLAQDLKGLVFSR